jgi:mersacidin/lichenicidin family type 2 lantibiotic
MSNDDIIRAWKDPAYRSCLNAKERELLPANPAGTIDDGKLAEVTGGASSIITEFIPCTTWCSYFCSFFWPCPV